MTPDEIEASIADGTFTTRLMQEVELIPKPLENGKTELTIIMPSWFSKHLTLDTQNYIMQMLQENIPKLCNSNSC